MKGGKGEVGTTGPKGPDVSMEDIIMRLMLINLTISLINSGCRVLKDLWALKECRGRWVAEVFQELK